MQLVLCWIKPIAEHISQFTFPRGTHFYYREHREPFFRSKLLQRCDSIHTVMIGDGYQAKTFTHQVVDQLRRRPCAIAVGGMQLEVNRASGARTHFVVNTSKNSSFHGILISAHQQSSRVHGIEQVVSRKATMWGRVSHSVSV
jgi:hypothetical protein